MIIRMYLSKFSAKLQLYLLNKAEQPKISPISCAEKSVLRRKRKSYKGKKPKMTYI